MGIAQLGNLSFRIDPDQISYAYQIDYSTIDTIGGQVIQVIGSTIGDITITGSFGEDHINKRTSWQLAESFHTSIRAMIDKQALPGNLNATSSGSIGPIHNPIPFTYHDGIHNWNMQVLIKGISDPSGGSAIEHSTGKFSYQYVLTLFLVQDDSLMIKRITTDQFISRMANGLGWKSSAFNGMQNIADSIAFIQKHSSDGTFQGYLLGLVENPPTTG